MPAGIKYWSTTAASNNATVPYGAPEGWAPSDVNNWGRQVMADTRSWYESSEWIDFGHTPTRTGNTTFTVTGDQTAIYTANRRIKCTDSSTLYGYISGSVYGAVTTVTVVLDSGNLSASLTAVSVGAISALTTGGSLPNGVLKEGNAIGATTPAAGTFTTLTASGLITANGGQIKFPASQSASADANTLDDYEEGTWTPVLTFATPGNLSVAYTVQSGSYTKIGRQVTLLFQIVTSTFTHTTASGNLRITGAPFTNSSAVARGVLNWQGVTKANYTQIASGIDGSSAIIQFEASGNGQTATQITSGDTPTGGTMVLNGAITYFV